jgi:hypothetical protein
LAIFTVHSRGLERDAMRDALVLRDGFSWSAFWLGPFWLLRHGLYGAFLALVVGLAVVGIAAATILTPGASIAVVVAIEALLGFEADHLLQRKLAGKGYVLVDIVAARDLDAAEVAFFRRLDAAGASLCPEPGKPS